MEHRQLRRTGFGPSLQMDSGCLDVEPMKGVYTIERLPEVPGKPCSGQHYRRSKVATLAGALLLGTLIVLLATAALVYTLRTVHTSYRSGPAATSSWASEMIVSGEFRVTNEPFRSSLYNLSSPDFRQLSKRIEKELRRLYGASSLGEEVQGVAVTSLGPGLQVRCSLALRPKDSLTIGKVGLAFLAGLNRSHGHHWLGPFAVDVLSIGFQARTEEVSWSQWSDWSDCQLSSEGALVRRRRRVCLSLDGLKLSRAEPCQAASGGGDQEETRPCSPRTASPPERATPSSARTMPTTSGLRSLVAETQTSAPRSEEPYRSEASSKMGGTRASITTPVNDTLPSRSEPWAAILPSSMKSSPPTTPSTTWQPSSTTQTTTTTVPEKIGCSMCKTDEVCVALEGDLVPLCRPMIDHSDPTGCGGLCQLNTEICHRLGQGAYRCVDDSKCLDNEWQCGNSLCIPLVKRCDGHFNCYDHTDEHNCDCELLTHFQCGKNLSCLPQNKRCDGIVDCWDAADESNCTIACLDETQFTCNDSQCIPSKNFCDGFVDCRDHSDEPFGCGGVCKNHEWRCRNGRCIVKRDVCNGQDDCGDSSDEIKCGKRRGARV